MISLLVGVALACQLLPVVRAGSGVPDDPFSFRVVLGKTSETVTSDGRVSSGWNPGQTVTLPGENAKIQKIYVAR